MLSVPDRPGFRSIAGQRSADRNDSKVSLRMDTAAVERVLCSAHVGEPFPVTQDGLGPVGQVLWRAVVVGPVADLVAKVVLRFLQMPLGRPDRDEVQPGDLLVRAASWAISEAARARLMSPTASACVATRCATSAIPQTRW